MRVITGTARGRQLKALKGMSTRPTLGRVKEALFNIIGPRVIDAHFLDLFAGTGGIGIEAISRGARTALFVEKNPQAVRVIRENLAATGLSDRAEIWTMEVEKAIKSCSAAGQKFNLVFMDPPYMKEWVPKTLTTLGQADVLAEDGLVVAEAGKMDAIPPQAGSLALFRTERYGDTLLTFYH